MAQGATAAIPAVGRSWLYKDVWLLPFVWGSGLAFLWRGFTFFWDEWNVLAASLEHPVSSVVQENGGNFSPLS